VQRGGGGGGGWGGAPPGGGPPGAAGGGREEAPPPPPPQKTQIPPTASLHALSRAKPPSLRTNPASFGFCVGAGVDDRLPGGMDPSRVLKARDGSYVREGRAFLPQSFEKSRKGPYCRRPLRLVAPPSRLARRGTGATLDSFPHRAVLASSGGGAPRRADKSRVAQFCPASSSVAPRHDEAARA